jgi:hypothetical protein
MLPIDSGMLPVSWFILRSLNIKYLYISVKDFKFPILIGMVPFRRFDRNELQSDNTNTIKPRIKSFRWTLEYSQ